MHIVLPILLIFLIPGAVVYGVVSGRGSSRPLLIAAGVLAAVPILLLLSYWLIWYVPPGFGG